MTDLQVTQAGTKQAHQWENMALRKEGERASIQECLPPFFVARATIRTPSIGTSGG